MMVSLHDMILNDHINNLHSKQLARVILIKSNNLCTIIIMKSGVPL